MLMKIVVLALLLLLIAPSGLIVFSQPVTISYPMGVSFFSPFTIYYTNEVVGVVNITNMFIGDSYLPNGQFLTQGNMSLQLNAMVYGKYWAQDVILFHQINNTYFSTTLVLNLWDLEGPFTTTFPKGNVSVYQGLGVLCYIGPTFTVNLPINIELFMVINSTSLSFGYYINGHKGIYYTAPIGGQFQIGGYSIAGVPNDLEFVFGGPGGGSCVKAFVYGSMNLYILQNGNLQIVPYALSVGFDTAESVVGISSNADLSNLWSPYVTLSAGSDDLQVLWPVKPALNVIHKNSSVIVNLSYNGKPIPWQNIELETLSITGLQVSSTGVTNSSGYTVLNTNSSVFVVYYPGNFTLASAYYISVPYLSNFVSDIESAYNTLVNFITHYNFKHAIVSFFGNVKNNVVYSNKVAVNYVILEYILSFICGVIISAILLKFKR
jgi:hypothetical protein